MNEEKIIEERKEKFIGFFKKNSLWVIGILAIILILGIYLRSLPMQDHGGKPGLWDITTNDWTLGPDLDPWLFTRYAQTIVDNGSLPKIDMMRNVPLGFPTSAETVLLPYMIVWTYDILNLFGSHSLIYSAALFPVIMFALTIISFFLFVREIFLKKDRIKEANIIALISTFFMIIVPAFISRTIAGIPEKESAGFFFMFLSFYLFLKAWKSEKLRNSIILAVLAGISTAAMGLIWGGMVYVFASVALAVFIAFLFNKISKKEIIIYSLWMLFSYSSILLFSTRFSVVGIIMSPNTGLPFLIFFVLIVHFFMWHLKFSERIFEKIKLPKNITSLIISVLLFVVLSTIFFGFGFISNLLSVLGKILINPTTGRWGQTVAENRQPYFTEWRSSFGPYIKNIPVLFCLFSVGSVLFFKKMFEKIKKKDSWILTGLYIFFFIGLIFSRYAPHPSMFDGENFISRFLYFGSSLLLIASFIYYYLKYAKNKDDGFEKTDFAFLTLFSLFIICLLSVRSAIRLIMVLAPVCVIFVAYLIIEIIAKFRKTSDDMGKVIIGTLLIIILVLTSFTIFKFYNETKVQAYNSIPSAYNQQWQLAMKWVREEAPQNAVFSHWWDYGYWVQSIGKRATVLDGGNAIAYWNYLMGRLVLTGDNEFDALEFLYNHNATHLLIDSSDIGKYGAFSSIGSNENYDRYSWMGAFLLDEKQTQETKNQTLLVYPGGLTLDEDLIINQNGKDILLPAGAAGVGAVIIPSEKNGDETTFRQPYYIVVYNGKQYEVSARYLYVGGKMVDFAKGADACIYIFPSLIVQGNGVSANNLGAALYLSPRLMRGMLVQKYILNDPFNNFPNFKLVHSEPSPIVRELNNQGMKLPEFIYYQGMQGPIKIWEIQYTGKETTKKEYLDISYSQYLNWTL